MALNLVVKVHPVVLFQIVDAYERRNADSHRVIGTLLGVVERGAVEVCNCFSVPHKEREEAVEAELTYAQDVFELNRRVAHHEQVVGWWATSPDVTTHSAVIHDYYARECARPVHLTLDTSVAHPRGRVQLRAYTCCALGVPGGRQGAMFTPVPVELASYPPELVALGVLGGASGGGAGAGVSVSAGAGGTGAAGTVRAAGDVARVAEAAGQLATLLDHVLAYVEGVLAASASASASELEGDAGAGAGVLEGDSALGRQLVQLVESVPALGARSWHAHVALAVKDLLMVLTLANLITSQLQLNEKLTLLTSAQ